MALFSRDSSIDIGLPLWPAKLVVPLAFTLLWLRLVLQLWGYGRAFRDANAVARSPSPCQKTR
jgi:TRAP-type mannitol/chloroaromatic compound transport system permease small subunit